MMNSPVYCIDHRFPLPEQARWLCEAVTAEVRDTDVCPNNEVDQRVPRCPADVGIRGCENDLPLVGVGLGIFVPRDCERGVRRDNATQLRRNGRSWEAKRNPSALPDHHRRKRLDSAAANVSAYCGGVHRSLSGGLGTAAQAAAESEAIAPAIRARRPKRPREPFRTPTEDTSALDSGRGPCTARRVPGDTWNQLTP